MTNLLESPASPDRPHADRVLSGSTQGEPVQTGSVEDGWVLGGLRSVADVVTGLGGSSAVVDMLSDEAVLVGHSLIAGARRASDTQAAWFAATLARRSRPESGGKGLAARQGFRTPEALPQAISGSSRGDAVKRRGQNECRTTPARTRSSATMTGPDPDGSRQVAMLVPGMVQPRCFMTGNRPACERTRGTGRPATHRVIR